MDQFTAPLHCTAKKGSMDLTVFFLCWATMSWQGLVYRRGYSINWCLRGRSSDQWEWGLAPRSPDLLAMVSTTIPRQMFLVVVLFWFGFFVCLLCFNFSFRTKKKNDSVWGQEKWNKKYFFYSWKETRQENEKWLRAAICTFLRRKISANLSTSRVWRVNKASWEKKC